MASYFYITFCAIVTLCLELRRDALVTTEARVLFTVPFLEMLGTFVESVVCEMQLVFREAGRAELRAEITIQMVGI